jgi:4-deoxy-L-threo-5-hexosulose-uronate ketol-isomerase
MAVKFEEKYAVHFRDFKMYDTNAIREHFLVGSIMEPDNICLTYSHYDRLVVGGIVPVKKQLELEPVDALKTDYFLSRRELGIINVGGKGLVIADNARYELQYKEALYLGKGIKNVKFSSINPRNPARFYINSAPAHKEYPAKHITLDKADVVNLGSLKTSNERKINKLIVNSNLDICQLQMGMTELNDGSVWNTMPVHTHSRRMEAYFYFEVPDNQAICHFMGQPDETRHIWLTNEQAVLSPPWSIHAAAGTSNYTFIWGMAGENLDYGDMDIRQPDELK